MNRCKRTNFSIFEPIQGQNVPEYKIIIFKLSQRIIHLRK
jgi:hypothetical protein